MGRRGLLVPRSAEPSAGPDLVGGPRGLADEHQAPRDSRKPPHPSQRQGMATDAWLILKIQDETSNRSNFQNQHETDVETINDRPATILMRRKAQRTRSRGSALALTTAPTSDAAPAITQDAVSTRHSLRPAVSAENKPHKRSTFVCAASAQTEPKPESAG